MFLFQSKRCKHYDHFLCERPNITYAVDWALKANYLSISSVARSGSSIASVGKLGTICHCDANEKGVKGFFANVNKNNKKNINVTRT